LTEKLELHIIELEKLSQDTNINDALLDWLYFLQNPESDRVIKKMKEKKELKQAYDKLEDISNDEVMQRLAEWRDSADVLYNTYMSESYEDGVENGKKNEKKEIAINLLKLGLDIDSISKATNLSIDEINELQKNL
jgi:predicted transposase/invertase (TIGR01784 family)